MVKALPIKGLLFCTQCLQLSLYLPSNDLYQKGQGDMEGDESLEDPFMDMDWGEEEEEKPKDSLDIFDEPTKSSLGREKSKNSEIDKPKNKFAEIMAKPPTPQVLDG